jgi:bifunctional DNA-binding transcriptional regulator/antitoxin component of YhaV-PrlF toxin-antitoxin module
MQKTLSRIGNSYALVIEKPLRRLLGIHPGTLLKVWTDGRRLVIEPTNDVAPRPEPPKPVPVPAPRIVPPATPEFTIGRLLDHHGMTQEQFDRVSHKPMRPIQLALVLQGGSTNSEYLGSLRRFEECLRVLDAGGSWDDAIAAALAGESAQLVAAEPVRDEHRGQA